MPRLRLLLLFPIVALAAPAPPKPEVPDELPPKLEILQPGVKLTLLAEHPSLVTPTGIDVDAQGNIWLIANHTHHRPEGYEGPDYDEVLVFDSQGKNRRVFYNKTTNTMNLQLGRDGWVYLAERSRILRIKDSDGDGTADTQETIAALNTVSDYPHNGLSGMAWHPDGGLVFSLGENFGMDWTLTARDGTRSSGRGEGGVFRCTPEGTHMRRIARGFWNPFGLLVRPDGEIFAAENDPGSRPPCRLLQIHEGSDYGYQWVYGSAPIHPFVAWNGELRGTLGMVHPIGEGPCSIRALGGGVLIPSWSNHCIDYFPLRRQGAGYTSERIELLRGSDFFRPVCLAPGPDGAFYMTDWVFSSYPIHNRGRLWKLEIDLEKANWVQPEIEPLNEATRLAQQWRAGENLPSQTKLLEQARGSDPYLADAALSALAKQSSKWTPQTLRALPATDRVWALVALRRVDLNDDRWVAALLDDPDPEIRFECLRWIADAVLARFKDVVEKMLTDASLDYRLFEAALATWNTLRGNPRDGVTNPEVLIERFTSADTPPKLKGYALRLIPATHKGLTIPLLREALTAGDPVLAEEAIRVLAGQQTNDAQKVLAEIAANEAQPESWRAEAIAGLSTTNDPDHLKLLEKLARDENRVIQAEAQRAVRFTPQDTTFALNPLRPPLDDTAAWLRLLDALPGKADPEAGRRLFFHPKVGLCATCHRHNGRGNVVGPDLTFVAQQGDRTAILRSILEPNREVAPQFYPTLLKLADGTDFLGILLRSSHIDVYRDLTGRERVFKKTDVVSREELKNSLMPPGLVAALTDSELRDLLAFLTQDDPHP